MTHYRSYLIDASPARPLFAVVDDVIECLMHVPDLCRMESGQLAMQTGGFAPTLVDQGVLRYVISRHFEFSGVPGSGECPEAVLQIVWSMQANIFLSIAYQLGEKWHRGNFRPFSLSGRLKLKA